MTNYTRILFYRGRKSQNPAARIGDRLICWVTGKQFSHCELVVSTHPIGVDTYATMLSSSLRDGGVRETSRGLVPSRWLVVEFDGDSKPAIQYIRGRIGKPYGWLDLLSFLLPFRVSTKGDFCSEVVAASLGIDDAWHKSPGDLFEWATSQPGARVLRPDEFGLPWSA